MAFSGAKLEQLKKQLVVLRDELTEQREAGRDAEKPVELDQTSVGRLSRMDAMQGQAMSKESGRRREISLQKIAAALKRMDKGDYGYCFVCEEEIAIKRLEFDPAATLCITCASKSEQ